MEAIANKENSLPGSGVWSSNRLDKERNIYANRYDDTSKRFRGFWHLMLQWKGSVLKLIYHDLIVYVSLYMCISLVYRFYLVEVAKTCTQSDHVSGSCLSEIIREWFECFCIYCGK